MMDTILSARDQYFNDLLTKINHVMTEFNKIFPKIKFSLYCDWSNEHKHFYKCIAPKSDMITQKIIDYLYKNVTKDKCYPIKLYGRRKLADTTVIQLQDYGVEIVIKNVSEPVFDSIYLNDKNILLYELIRALIKYKTHPSIEEYYIPMLYKLCKDYGNKPKNHKLKSNVKHTINITDCVHVGINALNTFYEGFDIQGPHDIMMVCTNKKIFDSIYKHHEVYQFYDEPIFLRGKYLITTSNIVVYYYNGEIPYVTTNKGVKVGSLMLNCLYLLLESLYDHNLFGIALRVFRDIDFEKECFDTNVIGRVFDDYKYFQKLVFAHTESGDAFKYGWEYKKTIWPVNQHKESNVF
jgi:hypothetical protein